MGLWPVLPGLLPGALLFHPHDLLEFSCMAIFSLLLTSLATLIASRGRWSLAIVCVVVLGLSIANAVLAKIVLHAG